MNRSKSLTRAAIASALTVLLAPGAARAEEHPLQLEIYGFLNAQVESVQARGGATPYDSRGRLSDGNSRIGFAGSIDVAPALKAVWQLEGGLNNFEQGGLNDQGVSATLESRNSFVGVAHDRFGQLVFGINDSAYRSLVGSGGELGGNLGLTVFGLDLWNNTSAQGSGNPYSIFGRGEARYKNSIHYQSPEWIVRAAASYAFDERAAQGRSRDRFSLAARVALAGFKLGVGYDRQRFTGVDVDGMEAGYGVHTVADDGVATAYWKAVASYTVPGIGTYVGLGYELSVYGYRQFVDPVGGEIYPHVVRGTMKQSGAMVSLAQPIGPLAVMASFGKLGDLGDPLFGAGEDYAASQLSAGLKYTFGPALATYVYFTRITNGSTQDTNLGQSPLYSNGLGTADAYLSPGNDPRSVGFGVIARF